MALGQVQKCGGLNRFMEITIFFFFLQKHPFPQLIYNYIRTLFTAIHHITEL